MSSTVDIVQYVKQPNLEKIQNFLNDSTYLETIEYSANFNSRLCLEKRLRKKIIDTHTRIEQNPCSLFMDRRMRMPGFRDGQLYTYPSARWRKSRRQYLLKNPFGFFRRAEGNMNGNSSNGVLGTTGVTMTNNVSGIIGTGDDSDFNSTLLEESSSLGGADTSDSKDSQNLKEDLPKEWFYDDIDMNHIDDLEEPKSPDDEYDYDPRYGNKKRKKRRPGRKNVPPVHHIHHDGPRKGRPPGGGGSGINTGIGRGRGRRKNMGSRNFSSEMPSSPTSEPPSFESVAAAVENASNDNDNSNGGEDFHYRKYL